MFRRKKYDIIMDISEENVHACSTGGQTTL